MAYDLIFYMMPIAESLMAGYCFYRFANPFMKRKRDAVCVGIAYLLTLLILYIMPLTMSFFIAYIIGVFVAFLVMCRLEQKNYEQNTFIAVTFFSLRCFAFAMAEILYDRLYNLIENTSYMQTHPNMDFALYVGVCMVYFGVEFLILSVSIWCILKNYKYKDAGMSKKELIMLTIPSLMGAVGYEVIWCYRRFYISSAIGNTFMIYEILSLLYYAAAIVTIVIVIVFYQIIKTGQEERLQDELLSAQIDSVRQHIEKVESLYRNIRGIRHDMANHIMTLERLYAGNLTEAAKDYNTQLKAALAETSNDIKSGNPVTDVILQEIQSEAEKRDVRFDIDFHYPADSNVNAFDVSVILNNALQNALENTKEGEDSRISICSYRRNNAYMIEVTNSFTGTLEWDNEKEIPVTSKGKANGHGYGLENIRRVAERYAGDIDIVLKEGKFHLSIMLMLE